MAQVSLSNGVLFHVLSGSAVGCHLCCRMGAGSRSELPGEEGLAHFVEHTLFKGTQHHSARSVLNRLDSVGGELNAYTTREATCVTATVLPAHLRRAAELCAELLFSPTFPDREVLRERDVVLDEIGSVADTPSDLVYDLFDQLFWQGSRLAHPILGTAATVTHFTAAAARRFVEREYRPQRLVVALATPGNAQQALKILTEVFGRQAPMANGPRTESKEPTPVADVGFDERIDQGTRQRHIVIGGSAPCNTDALRHHTALLANLLAGPANNARLSVALRERNGIGYNVEASYNAYRDAGQLTIYYGTDPEHERRAAQVVGAELDKLCQGPLPARVFESAKRQWLGQLTLAAEATEAVVEAQVEALAAGLPIRSTEETVQMLQESLTAEGLLEAARLSCADNATSRLVLC